jgi:acetyltransferase-like isoleucine patch superfamily enzyme
MRKLWLLVDRIKAKIQSMYRKNVVLSKVKNDSNDIRVVGAIDIRATNVTIGKNVTIYPGVMFSGGGEINIGDNVAIGKDTILYSNTSVLIGNDTAIAGQCYIIDANHGVSKGTLMREQPLDVAENGITIGSDVWIAAGCKILKGARIHDGAVIGAMSLVNSDIPENAIAFGIPAKVKAYRK